MLIQLISVTLAIILNFIFKNELMDNMLTVSAILAVVGYMNMSVNNIKGNPSSMYSRHSTKDSVYDLYPLIGYVIFLNGVLLLYVSYQNVTNPTFLNGSLS